VESMKETEKSFPPNVMAISLITMAITGVCHMMFSAVCLVLAVAAAKGWLAAFLYAASLMNFMFAVIHLGNPLTGLSGIRNTGVKK